MSHLRLALLLFMLGMPAVAGAADGGIYVYLQPLPAAAARVSYAVASIAAVAGDGKEYPLKQVLGEIGPAESSRQRLVASGRLPEGAYAGFTIRVARAALKQAEGQVALDVRAAPTRIDLQFLVRGRQSSVVWLSLKAAESLQGTSGFSPAFTALVPARPIADHAGFVSNAGSNTITVFDKQLMQAVAVIDTCGAPTGLALDQRGRRLYVACPRDDEIDAIDVATGETLARADVTPGDRPRELALTPDGGTLVATNSGSNSVGFFDTRAMTSLGRAGVGIGPGAIVIDPTGRRVFVFNTLSASISVVDIATRAIVATLATDAAPLRGQFNARGDRLYVINERSPYLTVFDGQQLTLVTRARVNDAYTAIVVDIVRGLICLSGLRETAVDFYDPNALLPLYSMTVRDGAAYLAIVPDDSALYLVSPDTRSLLVARLGDRKVVSDIDVGDGPSWVAIMGEK